VDDCFKWTQKIVPSPERKQLQIADWLHKGRLVVRQISSPQLTWHLLRPNLLNTRKVERPQGGRDVEQVHRHGNTHPKRKAT
jgi:hypothetical protein